jgi:hypothetical protein
MSMEKRDSLTLNVLFLENRFIALRDNGRRHFPLIRPRGIEKGGLILGKSIICQINKGDSERSVSLFNRIKHL